MLDENGPGLVRQVPVAELAGLVRVEAALPGVEVLAGEALVQVQALLLLGAPLKQVELAKLHYLGGLGVVGEHAPLRALRKEEKTFLEMF